MNNKQYRGKKLKLLMGRSTDNPPSKGQAIFDIEEMPEIIVISKGKIYGNKARDTNIAPAGGKEDILKTLLRSMALIATSIWRIRTKLGNGYETNLPSEMRHLPRHIQSAWDALAAAGIEIQDYKGQRYVPGMAVAPISFQPMEGISFEIIQETIKPSIYYKDSLIQRADVIVAQPIDARELARPLVANPIIPGHETISPEKKEIVSGDDPVYKKSDSKIEKE